MVGTLAQRRRQPYTGGVAIPAGYLVVHDPADTILFAKFRLDCRRRVLLAHDRPVTLHARAFDILAFLVANRDRVVGRDEIVTVVWRGLAVGSNNITVQMSALRRALAAHGGERLIVTVAGAGYRFVGDVIEPSGPAEASVVAEPGGITADARPALQLGPDLRPTRGWRWMWVGIAVLVVAAPLGYLRWHAAFGVASPRLSIVVLPFRNLGSDAGQTYLADAITDDLTTDLEHLPGSTVIARESADVYKDRAVPAQEIGRALNVRYLLEGSLTSEDAILHINVQLIDATTAKQLWADGFDEARDNLAQAREDIVRHIGGALNFQLVEIEAARSLHERPDNPDAIDLFLRARSILDRDSGMPGLGHAQRLLEQAIAAAPDYGDALGELGIVLALKIGDYVDSDEWRDHAELMRVVEHATAVAPQDPLVIASRARLDWEDDHCDQALPAFQLALSLDPDAVEVSDGLAQCEFGLGHMEEMIAGLQRLQRVDPAAPGWARRQTQIGFAYLMLGKPANAVAWLDRARASIVRPVGGSDLGWQEWNSVYLIAARWEAGDELAARDLYAAYREVWPHRSVWLVNSYNTRAVTALAGNGAFVAALAAAGMPKFADENQDFGVAATSVEGVGNDFAPTPLAIPGARRIETQELHAMLASGLGPLVLDVGRGTAVIPGTKLLQPQNEWGDENALLDQAVQQRRRSGDRAADPRIVVMGDGPLGWLSYNAALHLVATHSGPVLWYRGGEEAWAAARYAGVDQRPQ